MSQWRYDRRKVFVINNRLRWSVGVLILKLDEMMIMGKGVESTRDRHCIFIKRLVALGGSGTYVSWMYI